MFETFPSSGSGVQHVFRVELFLFLERLFVVVTWRNLFLVGVETDNSSSSRVLACPHVVNTFAIIMKVLFHHSCNHILFWLSVFSFNPTMTSCVDEGQCCSSWRLTFNTFWFCLRGGITGRDGRWECYWGWTAPRLWKLENRDKTQKSCKSETVKDVLKWKLCSSVGFCFL